MPAWRDFKATNEKGTCVWCGRALQTCRHDRKKLGENGDNLFCGIRCGYQFGVVLAKNGKRLVEHMPQLPPPIQVIPQLGPGGEVIEEEEEDDI